LILLAGSAGPGSTPAAHAQNRDLQRAGGAGQSETRSSNSRPSAEEGAPSTSVLGLPFKRLWRHLTEDLAALAPAMDAGHIYVPLVGGRVDCLDRETGALVWSAEPGGIITASPAVDGKSVYIVTRKISEDGAEAGGSLRAVDSETGLTLWVQNFARPFSSAVEVGSARLYASSADGSFCALSATSGEIVWKVDTPDLVRGQALATEHAVYFGCDDGVLRAVEPDSGKLIWKFQTTGRIVCKPSVDDRRLYFGSGDGFVYAIESGTGRLSWRSRTGAAVEATPVLLGARVFVASFDNFIYALTKAHGDRIWKRRLENRIVAEPIVSGDAIMIAPLQGEAAVVFLHADGRRVNFIQLEQGFKIVAEPILSGDLLLMATNKGLVAARATHPIDNRANAVKK